MRRYIYGILISLLVFFTGCELIHEDDMDCQLYTEDGVPYAYVAIELNTSTSSSSTRAGGNPTGGEEGDGREPGQSYENEVNDITLFFYEATGGEADEGVNSEGTTPIVARLHLTKNEFNYIEGGTTASTHPVEVEQLLVNHNYHVLAVVNGGDTYGSDFKTLGDLQGATVTSLYTITGTGNEATYSNFLMSSESDERSLLAITPSNSVTNPAGTTIDVERVAARVDYRAVGPDGEETENNQYTIEGVGTAKIIGAMLVNTLNDDAESYLLKRVTETGEGFMGIIIYLGDETPTPNGAATNFVMDPLSKEKSDKDMSANYDNYFNHIDYDNADDWENNFIAGEKITDSQDIAWWRVGYPKENTAEKGSRYYSTGIIFKAEIVLEEAGTPTTIFEYNGKVYKTLEEIMKDFEGENSWNLITGTWSASSWEDLQNNIIPHLRDNGPTGYKAFLLKEQEAGGAFDECRLRWPAYAEEHLHYTNEEGAVTIGDDTRLILSNVNMTADGKRPDMRIRTYRNGIAYYTYWIKHSNDSDNTNDGAGGGIMEYGIVRNNIYQLNVTGIKELGDDVPGDRTLEINVTVRNWEKMDEETVDMETETN